MKMEIPKEKKIKKFINNQLDPKTALELITLIITDETTLKQYLYIKDELELLDSLNGQEKLSDQEIENFTTKVQEDKTKLLSHIRKLKNNARKYNKKTSFNHHFLKKQAHKLRKELIKINEQKSKVNNHNHHNELQQIKILHNSNTKKSFNSFNSLNFNKI